MSWFRSILIVGLGFGVLSSAAADTFVLKNGSKYKGAILQEDRHEVEAITDLGIVRILKSNLVKIKKGSIWENNAYLKKAGEFAEVQPAESKVSSETVSSAATSKSTSTDYALRQREMEMREQELDLKRAELELLREEIKLRREEAIAEKNRPVRDLPQEPNLESTPRAVESISGEGSLEPLYPGQQPVPVDEESEEDRLRQIAIEEQQKQEEKKQRLETYRRLQETRQKQEGVTIRGKINPAGNERYETY